MAFRTRRGFSRRKGVVELRLDEEELAMLQQVLADLDHLVGPAAPVTGDPLGELLGLAGGDRPEDPALQRLFPDGYTDDDQASADFRRFTERGLRQLKSERLATAQAVVTRGVAAGGSQPVPLDREEAQAFLGALNDLRLVLGVRLGIVADEQDVTEEWEPDDPRMGAFTVYQWLTWLQAGLLDALAGGAG